MHSVLALNRVPASKEQVLILKFVSNETQNWPGIIADDLNSTQQPGCGFVSPSVQVFWQAYQSGPCYFEPHVPQTSKMRAEWHHINTTWLSRTVAKWRPPKANLGLLWTQIFEQLLCDWRSLYVMWWGQSVPYQCDRASIRFRLAAKCGFCLEDFSPLFLRPQRFTEVRGFLRTDWAVSL